VIHYLNWLAVPLFEGRPQNLMAAHHFGKAAFQRRR
jgi:hypothetical protein